MKLRTEVLGNQHPHTISASNNLALTYHGLGRLEEALQLQEEVLKLMTEVLGKHHPDTISASSNLSLTYHSPESPFGGTMACPVVVGFNF